MSLYLYVLALVLQHSYSGVGGFAKLVFGTMGTTWECLRVMRSKTLAYTGPARLTFLTVPGWQMTDYQAQFSLAGAKS